MTDIEKAEIKKLLKTIPDEFRLIEERISWEVIEEYYKIADYLEDENQTEILQDVDNWTKLESIIGLKALLVCLSEIGDVKSYRKIEEIISSEKLEILDFCHVALKFARLNLENNLSDQAIGFVSSGLGGKGNKLRYYFVVKSGDEIEKSKESQISNELINICNKNDFEFEEINNYGKYILAKVLVSMDYAIGNVIASLTNKCSFLDADYICTNVEKPSQEFIKKWLNHNLD